jgi:hypothetical protein
MREYGFSTSSLAHLSTMQSLNLLSSRGVTVVELSALREEEFDDVMEVAESEELKAFSFVSVHLPKSFKHRSETDVVDRVSMLNHRDWRFVVHPDAITDSSLWAKLGSRLCLENMDARKVTGRTHLELEDFFRALPESRFCLDIAHARQVDTSLSQAALLVHRLRDRISHVHMSDVDTAGAHWRLNQAAVDAFSGLMEAVPLRCPVIIESPIEPGDIEDELYAARLSCKEGH